MACTNPNWGFRHIHTNEPWEKPALHFMGKLKTDQPPHFPWQGDGTDKEAIALPCGYCDNCKLERSRQWAVRCMHEAAMYDENCFVTLTYDDEHLPHPNSLHLPHLQTFLKDLREHARRQGRYFRYYACGEYGERFHRPHYHLCLFGYDFRDKILLGKRHGLPIWRSPLLEAKWNKGRSEIGTVTFDSAAYVARYIMKKVHGPAAIDHYKNRVPEFTTMSRGNRNARIKGGIGFPWLEKWQTDVFPRDSVIVRGMPTRPPRYYDVRVELSDPHTMAAVKEARAAELATKARSTQRSRDAAAHITAVRLTQRRRELE